MSSAIESLYIFWVQCDCCSCIIDNFLPFPKSVEAGRTVGVEDRIGFTKNSFAVQLDSPVEIFVAICFITSNLEFSGVIFFLLLGHYR